MFDASYASSFIPRLERFSRREDCEDSEFDQFKSCTQGPDFSCQALAECLKENSTLKNLDLPWNKIGAERAKAWCSVRMVGKKGHRGRRHSHLKVKSVSWKTFSCQLSPVRPWPNASDRTVLWRTWIWRGTQSVLKGHRLGVWRGWCERERGKRAAGFHRKTQDMRPFASKV